MRFLYDIHTWWPSIDPCYHFLWDGEKYKYLLHLRSHRGKCHSFLHRPARSDSYPVGGPLHKKRWLLPQTYLEVGDKKEAGNDVRLLCDKRRAQRSQKFIMDDTRLAWVRGRHSGNRHGGWKETGETQKLVKKVQLFKECQIVNSWLKANKQLVAILLQSRWLDPDQTQGEADSIGRSRFILGLWSSTTTSSSEWWSGWKDI